MVRSKMDLDTAMKEEEVKKEEIEIGKRIT
jgi:hypothetical protein